MCEFCETAFLRSSSCNLQTMLIACIILRPSPRDASQLETLVYS